MGINVHLSIKGSLGPSGRKWDPESDVRSVLADVEGLDSLAESLGVTPLGEFGLGQEDGEDLEESSPFFASKEGITSLDSLIPALRQFKRSKKQRRDALGTIYSAEVNGKKIELDLCYAPEELVEELEELHRRLTLSARGNKRFRFIAY